MYLKYFQFPEALYIFLKNSSNTLRVIAWILSQID